MSLAELDQQLFTLLHPPLLHSLGESAWRLITSLALPLTLLVITALRGWQLRRRALPIVVALLNGLLAEQLSSRVLKSLFQRARPCTIDGLSTLSGCTGGQAMPSSHAMSICAGIGVLWFFYPKLRPLYVLGAALFILSRLALGLHYPGDLLVGAVLGSLLALLVAKSLNSPTWARP